MPTRPPHPCNQPGCGAVVHTTYCDLHAKRREAEQRGRRGTTAARGYGSKWQRARKTYLMRHPLCVECAEAGDVVAATVVDHITPHRGDQALFWDSANWQALCKRHHDRKTGRGG